MHGHLTKVILSIIRRSVLSRYYICHVVVAGSRRRPWRSPLWYINDESVLDQLSIGEVVIKCPSYRFLRSQHSLTA